MGGSGAGDRRTMGGWEVGGWRAMQGSGVGRGEVQGILCRVIFALLEPRGEQTALEGPGKPRKSICLGGLSVGFQLVV